jgi:tetratricopeptide (TPR) repeat protein
MMRGDRVGERFEILEQVAAGGMGIVYSARDLETGERAAVKLLREVEAETIERFVLEARVLERLDHPGIVGYLASGRSGDGVHFLAMEWLEGEDLAARLERGPLSIPESVAVARQVAEILGHAHAQGVVHRDVKPSNIFLMGGDLDRVRVLDFGVARLAAESMHLTQTGALLGTPAYMAPEQIRKSKAVDNRADLFSLGCVLFECLTGQLPFDGTSIVAVMTRILFDDAPPVTERVPETPEPLAALVARLLEKDRASRPLSARVVLEALEALDGPPAGIKRSRRAITHMESRLVSVVIAGAPRGGAIEAAPAALERIARDHRARVEPLIDGSIAAVLTGAAAAGDLCAGAARCALALRALHPGSPMALATGRAVLERPGALAEVIERAAELAAAPIESGIALDELTARLLGPRFVVGRDPFALFGESHEAESPLLLGRPSRFVGRSGELRALTNLLEECVTTPVARVAVLRGPAGSGKSRLRAELVARATWDALGAPGDGVSVWFGRGDPMREGAAHALLSDVVGALAGVKEGEPLARSRARLFERVGRHLAGDEARRVCDFLGEIAGVHFDDEGSVPLAAARQNPQLMADQTRRAFEDFVIAECSAGPVLLVLEDLQWGDRPSLSIVETALRRSAGLPLLVLGVARPEVADLHPDLWSEHRPLELAVGALSESASRELVRDVLGDAVDDARVDELIAQASGNAFYLEEIVRHVAEGRAEHIPETVLAMAQSRLEALPDKPRRVLRAASVFGETFWTSGLSAMLADDIGGDQVRASLDELREREVITGQPSSRFSEAAGREYRFRHGPLRDAAYAMLPDHDRVVAHRIAAEWLESAGESNPMLLAQHLELGDERGQASKYYRRAAEVALEANDLDGVLDGATRAAGCGVSDREAAELRLLEATALRWQARYEEAERRATDALAGLTPLRGSWYRAIEEIAEASLPLGKTHRLAPLGDAVRPPPGRSGPRNEFVIAASTLAMQLYLAGQMPEGDAVMDRLERFVEGVADLPPLSAARTAFARATRAMIRGDMGLTLEHARRAVEAYDTAGDLRNAALMRTNLAYAYLELGASDRAEATLSASWGAAERIGLPAIAAYAKQNLGIALYHQDRLEEALDIERDALESLAGGHDLRNEGFCLIYLGQIHWGLGDRPAAAAALDRALETLAEIAPARAYAEAILASQLRVIGDRQRARELATSAAETLDRLGGIDQGEARVRLEHALALMGTGDADAAWRAIEIAYRRLMDRAEKISDEAWRRSFLENVPENRRTCQLWSARP